MAALVQLRVDRAKNNGLGIERGVAALTLGHLGLTKEAMELADEEHAAEIGHLQRRSLAFLEADFDALVVHVVECLSRKMGFTPSCC